MKSISIISILAAISMLAVLSGCSYDFSDRQTAFGSLETQAKSVILVGWDGVRQDTFFELLAEGKLPAVSSYFSYHGRCIGTTVASVTHTKPGWAEILTGYGPSITSVVSNI